VRSKRIAVWVMIGTATLLAGCGGHQNPLHKASVHVPRWVTGLWDGLTVGIAVVWWIIIHFIALFDKHVNASKFGLIAHHHGGGYLIGYVIGLLLFLSLMFGGYRRRAVRRRTTVLE
jgi:hypothetical protein